MEFTQDGLVKLTSDILVTQQWLAAVCARQCVLLGEGKAQFDEVAASLRSGMGKPIADSPHAALQAELAPKLLESFDALTARIRRLVPE